MKRYKEEIRTFLNDKKYMVCLIVITMICYTYAAVQTTLSIDDLAGEQHIGSGYGMIASGRMGMTILLNIFGTKNCLPQYSTAIEILCAVFFAWAAINYCIFFKRVAGSKLKSDHFILFSCMLVSYPLINEIWEFTGANLCVAEGYLFISFTMLLLQEYFSARKEERNLWSIILSVLMLMLVASAYESLICVYVFMVFALILFKTLDDREKKYRIRDMIGDGIPYAIIVAASIILELIVYKVSLVILRIPPQGFGDKGIYWGTESIGWIIKSIVGNCINEYLIKGFIYFPIAELDIAILLFIILGIIACILYKNVRILFPGMGIFLAVFSLSIIQGKASLYRTCEVFGVFVAFVGMLALCMAEERIKKVWIANIVYAAGILLCVNQAVYLSGILNVNHLRSEEEADVIKSIAYDLGHDHDMEKPVIFVGEYTLSEYITEAVSIPEESKRWKWFCYWTAKVNGIDEQEVMENYPRKYVVSNVNSLISTSAVQTGNQTDMQDLFAYYGFEYKTGIDTEMYKEASDYAEQHDMKGWPVEGYIVELDDMIIVNLK